MNSGWTYHDRVLLTEEGLTVLDYYTQRYRHSSREEWQQRIEAGSILLDGAKPAPETPLRKGQQLIYHRPPWQEPNVPLNFDIVYEDKDIMVIAKPAGLPVMPGGGFLEHTLIWQLQQRYPDRTPFPVHRLGRGTSGLLLLGRSRSARACLSQQMRQATISNSEHRSLQKIYRALVQGTTMPDTFQINQPIGKWTHPFLGHIYAAHPDGLSAFSECRVIRRDRDTTLVEVTIRTGRPHQIRIHLAWAGYPLVGDPLYTVGGIPLSSVSARDAPVPGDCGYHLHAMQLQFTHPNGEKMHFTCPPPKQLDG